MKYKASETKIERCLSDGFILHNNGFKMRFMDYSIREAKAIFKANYIANQNKVKL